MSDFEWTEQDSAYANWEALPEGHPARVVKAFNDLAWTDPLPVDELAAMVTPEVRPAWGDFSSVADYFRRGIGIGLNLRHIGDVRDVAYVKLIADVDTAFVRPAELVPPLDYVTLVWRPELDGWKIHRIGSPAEAHELPRTAPDDAPDY